MQFTEVAALVVFLLVIALVVLLVLVPLSVQLPAWTRLKGRVPLHYSGVPVVGVLLMLACGCLNGATLAAGIVGDANLKPYGIVILFMALAYISTSLDMTGCFGWLALHITRRSKGNGPALFLLYFAVSSIITIFTSNDISIMTLTPIIYYFSAATSTDAVPFLTAMFTAANIWSMLLFVGNPTNIIVAVAYQMSFADYSKWMALPTLGAGLSCLAVLLLVHARSIPRRLTLPDLQPALLLMDRPGAALGSINIVACLGMLAAAPSLGWELWPITLVCAGLHAGYNFIAYVVFKGRWCRQAPDPAAAAACSGTGDPQQEQRSTAAVAGAAAPYVGDSLVHDTSSCGGAVEMAAPMPCGGAASSVPRQQQQQQQGSHILTQPTADEVLLTEEQHLALEHHQQQPGRTQSPVGRCRCLPALHPATPQHPVQPSTAGDSHSAPAGAAGGGLHCSTSDADIQVSIHKHHQSPPPGKHQHSSSMGSMGGSSDAGTSAAGSKAVQDGCSAAAPAGRLAVATGASGLLQELKRPSFCLVLRVLPYEVVPFVLGMFILVEGLNATGWVDRLAWWLGNGVSGNVWAALFAVGSFSVLVANLANNQPCTILMTRVCMSPVFAQAAARSATATPGPNSSSSSSTALPSSMGSLSGGGSGVPVASAFAVVVASNVAANYTVMGALAGIMFVNILQRKGLKRVGYATFSKLMLPAGVASTVVALAILGAEFAAWH